MTEADKLWDYYNPRTTEEKFREMAATLNVAERPDEYRQLQTQIGRALGLQQKFDEAHTLLNEVEQNLNEQTPLAYVRYQLERGRVYNSSGKKQEAKPFFEEAMKAAKELGEDFYAIDALHMLAIILPPDEGAEANERAIVMAESSANERAKGWLGSLYNNLAWSYFDMGQYEKALSIFLRALKWREEKGTKYPIFLAKWCVARTLRALNRLDEAITIQLALFEESVESDSKDGYVFEELGELYLLKNDSVHQMYFQLAYTELSKDEWLAAKEPQRIARLKELAGVKHRDN